MSTALSLPFDSFESRLVHACSEGADANFRRFLRYLGQQDGVDVVELQALHAMRRSSRDSYPASYAAHASTADDAVALLTQAVEQFDTPAFYCIANRVDPAAATRRTPKAWHKVDKGNGTTDRDIAARRVGYIDIDSRRPKGTSATDAEMACAVVVADVILARFSSELDPSCLGLGHSGNGRAVFFAVDSAESETEIAPLIKGIVHAVKYLYATDGADIDTSVTDAKRLVPAFGSMKCKGAPGIAERPHRCTGFVCDDHVTRVSLADLRRLFDSLAQDLTPDQLAIVHKAMGLKAKTLSLASSTSSTTPYDRANAVPIVEVVDWLGISRETPTCPGCHESGAGVALLERGLKCSHNRCSTLGKNGFRTPVDLVAEARGIEPRQAVAEMASHFGFQGFTPPEPVPAPSARIVLTPAADVFAPLPPVPYLCEGLRLAPGAPVLFAGFGFSGKTLTAQSLGFAIAAGLHAFGVHPTTAGRVVHVDYEQGARVTHERYQRLARAQGVDPRDLGDRLATAILPSLYLDGMHAEDEFTRIADGASLLVVDSLRAATPTVEENSSSVRRYLDILGRVSEKTSATCIVIHHARKPSENAQGGAKMTIRGSSAIFDACGGVFVFAAEKGRPTTVHHEKDRIVGVPLDDFGLRVEDVSVAGDPRGGVRVVQIGAGEVAASRTEGIERKIRDHVRASPGLLSAADLATRTGHRKADVQEAVRTLMHRGELLNVGTTTRPRFQLSLLSQ